MKVAIFDLDGTIADTLFDLADAVNKGLEYLGFPVHTYEEYKKFLGNGAQKLCERALPDDKKELTDNLHELFKINYAENYLCKTRLFEGIHDLLKKLRENNVAVAVATNKPENFAVGMIAALLPDIDFVKVLGGTMERPKKPDTAIIDDILSSIDNYSVVYMIGDSNVDIRTAKNAGIVSIGCDWGFREREELRNEGADYIVSSPEEISQIILN